MNEQIGFLCTIISKHKEYIYYKSAHDDCKEIISCVAKIVRNEKMNGDEVIEQENYFLKLLDECLADPSRLEREEIILLQAKKKLDKIKEDLKRKIKCFLFLTLPKALWKREYDKDLNVLEQILLMELIPFCSKTTAWSEIIDVAKNDMESIAKRSCRECFKVNAKVICTTCKKAYFCSTKCKRQNMMDKFFGHYNLECLIIK
jgi:hypothetical protein